MKTLKNLLLIGIGSLGIAGNIFGQNTDSLKIEQNKQVHADFKEFVKEKGKLSHENGVQSYIYTRGCKNVGKCGYFYNGQLHTDTIKEDLVINFSAPDSINPDNEVYYYFNDEEANGLDDNDYYFSYKYVKKKQTNSFLSLGILEYVKTESKGEAPYGTPFKNFSEEDKQKAREYYDFVIKEIMHDAIYKEY